MAGNRNPNDTTSESGAAGEQTFTWSTPLRHEAGLLDQLRSANQELLMSFRVALHAGRRGLFDAAALAISRCTQQLHAVQRLEALRLYPPISRRMSEDPETAAMVTSLRREANGLARRFMRLTEGLFTPLRPGMPSDAVVSEAESVLRRYLVEKESRLYRFYALTAPVGANAA
jgi:hypothetical protein